MALQIAMVVPPVSDLNTMYSAAPRLAAWLRALGHRVDLVDLSLETALKIFSRDGLERLFAAVHPRAPLGEYEDVYLNRERYLRIIDDVIAFLQGRDPALAHLIVRGDLLPEGPNFRDESPHTRRERYGAWGKVDLARHLATQMLLDLTELFQTITPHLGLVSYAAKLSRSTPSFDEIAEELARPVNAVEALMLEVADQAIAPDVDLVCFTCPFPGMLTGSLVLGKWLATHRPRARRALGGGFPSTELRELADPRFFDHVDYLVLDDGETPLDRICAHLGDATVPLHKTFTRSEGRVVYHQDPKAVPVRFRELPTPDYQGVEMNRYLQLLSAGGNIFNRLLNDGPWLKLTAAHGCYWKKCTFCDIHLDYIQDFDPLPASKLADQMDALHAQTGIASYHFTDEAAPPPLLVNLALELLRRNRCYQYFGNIRYDTGFTPDRCRLLAASGMIAVTGGIEIASDALLPKIDKGITVPQVVKVLQAFRDAGIMTHAYLIYGFPGETLQDTVNSLETLRQLFRVGLLQSAVFHRFSLTAHAPVAKNPELFGIRIKEQPFGGFSRYDLEYESVSVPHPDRNIFKIVEAAVQAYLHHKHLDSDVRAWFGTTPVPVPTISLSLVEDTMKLPHPGVSPGERLCWLGGVPRWAHGLLNVSCQGGDMLTTLAPSWLAENLARCHPSGWTRATPPRSVDFAQSDWIADLRARGMVLI